MFHNEARKTKLSVPKTNKDANKTAQNTNLNESSASTLSDSFDDLKDLSESSSANIVQNGHGDAENAFKAPKSSFEKLKQQDTRRKSSAESLSNSDISLSKKVSRSVDKLNDQTNKENRYNGRVREAND